MPYLESDDGLSIWYVDRGPRASEGIFLIHGDGMSSKFWARNIGVLAREFRVVAADIRGRGESAKPEADHSLSRYAADVHCALVALGLERIVAVGWSIGAFILVKYLLELGATRLAGLVVVDQPPLTFVSEEDLAQRVESIRARRIETAMANLRRSAGPEVPMRAATLRWMAAEALKIPPSCQIPALLDAYHSDFRNDYPNIILPTLICSAKYGLIRPETVGLWQQIPNSQVLHFERSGHLLPWTEADKFNAALSEFAHSALIEVGRRRVPPFPKVH
jgi:pimeloyl-ACP methyl ester carboxylesterase